MILPRTPAPDLSVPLAGGGTWSLGDQAPAAFTMIVVYRGLHCPICKGQLQALQGKLDAFAERGVDVIAVSADSEERATRAKQDWCLDALRLGYGLDLGTARKWGLFISAGMGKEPEQFAEPGIFLIKPDGALYFAAIQNMPFARPPLDEILGAIDFVVKNDYPARGEVAA